LGKGNLGLVISRAGVGKTALLVGIALDDLMHDRKVLHVSVGDSVERIRAFYDDTFRELVKPYPFEEQEAARSLVEGNRHIHCFPEGGFRIGSLLDEILFLRDHADFRLDTVILDDFSFSGAGEEDLQKLKGLAKEREAEVWMSVLSHRDSKLDPAGYPDPVGDFDPYFSIKIFLEPVKDSVRLRLLKDHENESLEDLKIDLDPTTLLLRERGWKPATR
jgi:hypothetical protein